MTLILFIGIMYRVMFNQTLERTIAASQQEVGLMTKSLNTFVSSLQNFSKMALINQTMQTVLSENNGTSSDITTLKSVYNTLAALVESEPNADSIIIAANNGDLYFTSNLTGVTKQSLSVYPEEPITAAKGGAVWTDTFRSSFQSGNRYKNMISVARVIVSMEKGTPLGTLYVNMDERVLAQMLQNEQDPHSHSMVVNGDGMILSASDEDKVSGSITGTAYEDWINASSEGSRIFKVEGEEYLISYQTLDKFGWKVVHMVPTSTLMQGYWKIVLLMSVFGVICMLTAIVLSIVFTRRLTTPLSRLSRAIEEVGSGRLDARAPVETNDEIGRLGAAFNDMVDRIRLLLNKVESEEKKKRLIELRLLYSQIKPHFLYNTLDTVRSMAVMANARDISSIVKALGDFYRISLSNGQELISVRQEEKHLRSYLYIQEIRFKSLRYRIHFEEGMEEYKVPTMLLQPLVENAIHHGIREMPDGGLCEIIGYIEHHAASAGRLCFIVRDNGKGMNETQLKAIWSKETGEDLYSFGLKNIQDRIRLRFGSEYGIAIQSEPGKGVEVQVRLPLLTQNTDWGEEDIIHECVSEEPRPHRG